MSAATRVICLEISGSEREGRTRFAYQVRVDDQVILANQELTKEQANEVTAIGETYASLFEQQIPEKVGSAQLQAIGSRLFKVWLQPWWDTLAPAPAGGRQRLVIASLRSDVLNLPWELLVPSGRNHVGIDSGWGICRVPAPECQLSGESYLEAGPLRVLFLTASPRDQDELNYEQEEEFLLSAIKGAFVEVGDLGTYDELKDRLDAFRPHVVHLSGHGTIGDHGAAFVFEDEQGLSDRQPAAQLGRLFSGTGVRCVFVSGCVSGQAPPRETLGGICQSLVAHGVPMAIGWAAAILDVIATQVAKSFYGTLVNGQPVDFALARARSTARGGGPLRGDPSWSLPVLYATVRDQRVYDESMKPRGEPAPSRLQQPLPKMMAGYARQFTGRRPELQAILPRLRSDERKGVIITGMGGTGKSSFATRLARKLEAGPNGLEPVVVPCEPNIPTKPEQLSTALKVAYAGSARAIMWNQALADAGDSGERFQILIKILNESRFVLVWDNFENNLDLSTRKFLNKDIEYFYNELLAGLVGTSRVIITSRYLPAEIALPDTFAALNLGEFSQTSYIKFLVRDDKVRRLYLAKKLPRSLLLDLRRRFGSAPKFVQQMRGLLPGLGAEKLAAELKNFAEAQGASPAQASFPLRDMHNQYCDALNLSRLFGDLPAGSRMMLSRLGVFTGPVTAEVIEKIGEASLEQVTAEIARWRASALVHAEPEAIDKIWSVYGTLRAWLTESARLPADKCEAAHRAAAQFLLGVANGLSDDLRHSELQLGKVECLQLARNHYLAINDGTSALEVGKRLNQILLRENRYAELAALNEELVEYTSHPEPATWAARAYLEQNNYDVAREWYTKALKLAESFEEERAHALQGFASLAIRDHNSTEARALLDQALTIQKTISDRKGEGVTWHQLGSIDLSENNYTGAREKFTTALKLLTGDATVADQQATEHQFGSLEFQEGRIGAAKEMLEKALRTAYRIQDKKAIAAAIHQLGRVAAKLEKDPRAGLRACLPRLKEALDLRRKIGDGIGEAQSFRRISELVLEAGQPDLALKLAIVSHYLYKTFRDANAKLVRESVARQADEIGHNAEQLRALMTEVEDEYLRDRGKALLREVQVGAPESLGERP